MSYPGIARAQQKVKSQNTFFRVSQTPKKFLNCVAMISSIIDVEPFSFEEVNLESVW
jgi:hypothetical protein